MYICQHAFQRFEERFPNLNIYSELKSSVPFGGQSCGKSQLLISKNDVVFAITNEVVKTVLTKELALGNVQAITVSTSRKRLTKRNRSQKLIIRRDDDEHLLAVKRPRRDSEMDGRRSRKKWKDGIRSGSIDDELLLD